MIETIILAFVLAKLKGYKLGNLLKSRAIYPVILLEIIYIFFQVQVFIHNYSVLKYSMVFGKILIFSFILLIYKHKQYINAIIGSIFVILGSILNNIAIHTNGGKMPVFPTLSYLTGYIDPKMLDKYPDIHVISNGIVNFKFLTDIFDIGYSVLSIGDIFIRVFVFIIIYGAIKECNKKSEIINDITNRLILN